MNHEELVQKIIFLPRILCQHQNLSPLAQLTQTGYFQRRGQIIEERIREALRQHHECVEDWLLWSENKRTCEGWYLLREGAERYLVGYSAAEAGTPAQIEYAEGGSACAAFIMRELEVFLHRNHKMGEQGV
jgi:hypothetical protein